MDKLEFPDYENPPVIEVVCGVLFKHLDNLFIPYFGQLWDRYRSEYPECSEQTPLWPQIEAFEGQPAPQLTIGGVGDLPPLPRIWFHSKDNKHLIQVQRDRFLHNWRRLSEDGKYPRYPKVFSHFEKQLCAFDEFLFDIGMGPIEPLQYELTYVNHIVRGQGWETLSDIGKVFPDFGWRCNESRLLGEPEGVNWQTQFALPNDAGRLHMVVRRVFRKSDKMPILQFELTARGISQDNTRKNLQSWFDLGREWIVKGFADLTSKDAQEKLWGRK